MASIIKVNTIQDATNSNTAMTIDSTGRILTPARPAFRATIAGSSSSHGDQGVLIFETEDFDTGGNYDHTNGTFTAPIAGIYHFMFRSLTATTNGGVASNDGDVVFADIQKNGSNVSGTRAYSYFASAGAHHATLMINQILQLSATDTIRINVPQEFVYSDTNAQNDPTFQGYLLG